MLLLALDTSTRQASVALCAEDLLLGEYTWQIGNNHSVELLERISRLLAECGIPMQSLGAVAVATGPGSFNGARVAVATAKTLAFALDIPLVGISTLDIIAAQQQQWPGPICAVLEAGRSELYAACYFSEVAHAANEVSYKLHQLGDYLLDTPANLTPHLHRYLSERFAIPGKRELPSVLFCGEMSAASRKAFSEAMPEQCLLVSPLQAARHASVLALLAYQRIQYGEMDDPLLLEPLYLRRPSITNSSRKQPLLGSKAQRTTGQTTTEREEGALHY
ncbi:MAG TPA: tRNA (adenosine(37)-N6)-threonylcarbamoyltransferase complex dimerization subunit type 1 TsaB [Ktedonobacteraceae bacterium]|jgi:tRNA threonylcarbamoyladenosine biosynthesis protein TsaB|nr:tRNA (adenosine(37)-N6)-threonylcarbamoyltransferase complex dimerization subunit type 1 TsaB [Ktedonobacteraceae bacterium]